MYEKLHSLPLILDRKLFLRAI